MRAKWSVQPGSLMSSLSITVSSSSFQVLMSLRIVLRTSCYSKYKAPSILVRRANSLVLEVASLSIVETLLKQVRQVTSSIYSDSLLLLYILIGIVGRALNTYNMTCSITLLSVLLLDSVRQKKVSSLGKGGLLELATILKMLQYALLSTYSRNLRCLQARPQACRSPEQKRVIMLDLVLSLFVAKTLQSLDVSNCYTFRLSRSSMSSVQPVSVN